MRFVARPENSFTDLVARMERPLFYYATKLTGNAETALDVLQDVWMNAPGTRGTHDYPPVNSPSPWFARQLLQDSRVPDREVDLLSKSETHPSNIGEGGPPGSTLG